MRSTPAAREPLSTRRRLGLAVLVACLAGCSKELPAPIGAASAGSGAADAPRRGGLLTTASFGDIRTLDPAGPADGLASQTLQALYAGLLDYDERGQIAADLAERWSVSPSGTEITFELRRGVRFHDGEELEASDVKRSVERALHPSAPTPYASYFASLRGYADYAAEKSTHLEGVRVDGRYVVTFLLTEPDSSFLPLLALHTLRPVCKSAGDRYVDTWAPCGAGPFKLPPGGWDRGRQVTFVRHDGYFRPGEPYLDGVRLLLSVNLTSQRFKFFGGDQDVVRDVLAPDTLRLRADPRWAPFGAFDVEKQIGGEAMNVEVPPFDNVEIRRAVAAALDRDQLTAIRASNLRPAYVPVPPSVVGASDGVRGQRHDLAAALEHMRRAGYPFDPATGKGGYPHVVPHLVYKQGLSEFLAQVEQQQLARIGIRTEIRVVNYPAFLALRARRGAVALGPGNWQQDYPEAGSFLEPLFHSRSINDDESNNWSFYSNPRVDALVDQAKRELDEGKRRTLYAEAQEIVCDEAPWAFTFFYRFYTQWQPYVRGFSPHPLWGSDHRTTWLDRAPRATAGRALFSRDAFARAFDFDGPRRTPARDHRASAELRARGPR